MPGDAGTKSAKEMEWASKVMSGVSRASSNNTVINVILVGSFVGLSMRSVSQQKDMEALEAEKESLLKDNKSMKKAMWDWKQQLFAEASSTDSPLVPLSNLKAIYGETSTPQSAGDAEKGDGKKSPVSKFLI